MKLKVNGTSIRVVDRIELEIDVSSNGDTLLNGFNIIINGGPLTIESGDSSKHAAMYVQTENQLVGYLNFFINTPPITFTNNESITIIGYKM